MILVDTSVWIDHLRRSDPTLSALLERREILAHPFIIGELALGSLKQRGAILDALRGLPSMAAMSPKYSPSVESRNVTCRPLVA